MYYYHVNVMIGHYRQYTVESEQPLTDSELYAEVKTMAGQEQSDHDVVEMIDGELVSWPAKAGAANAPSGKVVE